MPEEILESQSTTLEDSADYSEQESQEEADYSESSESETESDKTESEDKEDAETTASEDDLPDDPVALKELVKKHKEEAKAHQAAFTKKAQEAAELKKIKEQEALKAEETEIIQLDESVKQSYEYQIQQNNIGKSSDLQALKDAYENGTTITWYNGQVYEVNESNYDQMKEAIIEMRLNKKIELDNLKYQANQQVNSKKFEKYSKDRERFYSEFEANTSDRIAKLPELKDVIDTLRESADPDPNFANGILDKFEALIKKAVDREILQRQEKAENQKATSKTGGAINSANRGVPKSAKTDGYSIDDILAMDDSEIAKRL